MDRVVSQLLAEIDGVQVCAGAQLGLKAAKGPGEFINTGHQSTGQGSGVRAWKARVQEGL